MRGYANLGTTKLTAAYTAGGGEINIAATSGYPVTPFTLKVDSELFAVLSASGGVLSVVGAQEDTAAANHRENALVYWGILTAADIQQLQLATRPQPRMRSASERIFLYQNFT